HDWRDPQVAGPSSGRLCFARICRSSRTSQVLADHRAPLARPHAAAALPASGTELDLGAHHLAASADVAVGGADHPAVAVANPIPVAAVRHAALPHRVRQLPAAAAHVAVAAAQELAAMAVPHAGAAAPGARLARAAVDGPAATAHIGPGAHRRLAAVALPLP